MRFPGFIGPSYTLQSVNIDCQRSINLFPEINALGTGKEREVAALVPTPGKRLLVTLPTSPVRGSYTASNNEVYVVGGNKLYSLSSSFVATELGTLTTSSGPVSMADNGTEVLIVDGTNGYAWNMTTDTFQQIADPDFFAADQVVYIDGYFICNKKGSQFFFISGINDITFDALDIGAAEGFPDSIIGLVVLQQKLYLFGTQSGEVFYNAGDALFPFIRIPGQIIDIGCSATFSIAKIGETVFFLGGDATGTGIVYAIQGSMPKRVSTFSIEQEIRKLTQNQISRATSYTYQQGGHQFYCLNIPGLTSTWVYDLSTQFWHERQYLSLWGLERDLAECHNLSFGLNTVGDWASGNIYELDRDSYSDNGISVVRERTSPHFSQGLKFVRHSSFQLDMETGVGLNTGQGIDPQVMLQWSDDGGHSWSNEYWVSAGAIGKTRTRVKWRRLGISRDRVYRVRISDPVKVVLLGVEIEAEEGAA